MNQIEEIGPWIERLGVATVLLFVGLGFAWRTLTWLGKRVDKWFDAQLVLMDTLQQNESKHIKALEIISSDAAQGHATTHRKIDEVHTHVKEVRNDVTSIKQKLAPERFP